jgi:hypothetical protein
MPYSHLAERSPRAGKLHSFLVGLVQMSLMSINVRNMAEGYLVFLIGFTLINTYVWIYVVTTAIHSTKYEKFIYAIGSAAGAVLGVTASHYFIQPHAFTHLGFTQ